MAQSGVFMLYFTMAGKLQRGLKTCYATDIYNHISIAMKFAADSSSPNNCVFYFILMISNGKKYFF